MENNLYYTPIISEFHVGFECEILGIIGAKEDERLFSQPTIISQKELLLIDRLEIRVKYLDQSDIESLGWKSDQYVPERNICLNFKKPNDWYLNYWFGQTPYIEISRDGYDTGCALNVKNKSQLKFIMTCLGILE